jgi:hypothetical protein
MSRYVARPRAAPDGGFDDPLIPHLDVSDHRPVRTGLLDMRGDPIWRCPEPIGFHNPRERA